MYTVSTIMLTLYEYFQSPQHEISAEIVHNREVAKVGIVQNADSRIAINCCILDDYFEKMTNGGS